MPRPTCNPDGSVTYWSAREQRWIDHAHHVPGHELARMPGVWREQIKCHLAEAKLRREQIFQ